jgi:hypothetical protein
MKIDNTFNKGRGPPTIRIQGQTCHRMGSLLPLPGQSPKFAQLYIYDTDNEINNRMQGFRYSLSLIMHVSFYYKHIVTSISNG